MARKSKGITPPQHGRIVEAPQKPVITAGQKPQVAVGGYPPMANITGGAPPRDVSITPAAATNRSESHVRGGGDPFQGKIIKGFPLAQAASGTAPPDTGNGGVRSKSPSDLKQIATDSNSGKYAKGGKIKEERTEGKAERAAEHKNPNLENLEKFAKGGKINCAAGGTIGYAKGGKINRHGVDPINGGVDINPAGTRAPANGGNGGLPGGNAPIPLAQPGGTPSTGIEASGRLLPSGAGADTDVMSRDGRGNAPQLRGPSVKRMGGAPSLPRPRRGF